MSSTLAHATPTSDYEKEKTQKKEKKTNHHFLV